MVHLAKATPNLAKDVRPARSDISDVMKHFHSGKPPAACCVVYSKFYSRNCTKHNCRCDYMDMPAAGEEPSPGTRPPDLMITPEMQTTLDNWRITGDSPFPELKVPDRSFWTRFSSIDLRLIYHITALSVDLHRRGYAGCTAWAPNMAA